LDYRLRHPHLAQECRHVAEMGGRLIGSGAVAMREIGFEPRAMDANPRAVPKLSRAGVRAPAGAARLLPEAPGPNS